ncbi:MAG: hypothetical protein ACJ8LG_02230 [Massilia sp.]
MDKYHDKRQQLLLDLMNTKGTSSPPESMDQLLLPWRRLAVHLSPLIGESGFCALYVRAARLAASEFDWLVAGPSCHSIVQALSALGETYGTVDPAVAQAGNAGLLNTFTKLLADLIGEALTIRLLHSATSGAGEQKNAQEHK